MTIRKLVSEIAKREGQKSNVTVGDIREILGILSDIVFEVSREFDTNGELESMLWENGQRRAKRKKK